MSHMSEIFKGTKLFVQKWMLGHLVCNETALGKPINHYTLPHSKPKDLYVSYKSIEMYFDDLMCIDSVFGRHH